MMMMIFDKNQDGNFVVGDNDDYVSDDTDEDDEDKDEEEDNDDDNNNGGNNGREHRWRRNIQEAVLKLIKRLDKKRRERDRMKIRRRRM